MAMIENLMQKTYSDDMQECINTMKNLPKRSLLLWTW